MSRPKLPIRAFKDALRSELTRAVSKAKGLADCMLTLNRRGCAHYDVEQGTPEALRSLNRALQDVNFAAIGDACGVRTDWSIMAAFDAEEEKENGSTLLLIDSDGNLEEVHMMIEDFGAFRRCLAPKRRAHHDVGGAHPKRARGALEEVSQAPAKRARVALAAT